MFGDLTRLRPGRPASGLPMATAAGARGPRRGRGRAEEAVAASARRSRSGPTTPRPTNLGVTLSPGEAGEAVAEYREAIRLKPNYAEAHYNLGNVLRARGSWTRRSPIPRGHPAQARLRHGPPQPRRHPGRQGKLDEAIAEYREAIRLKPDYGQAHSNLGRPANQGKRTRPSLSTARPSGQARRRPAHSNLGIALRDQGKVDEAIDEYREAIRIRPDLAEAHVNLGLS